MFNGLDWIEVQGEEKYNFYKTNKDYSPDLGNCYRVLSDLPHPPEPIIKAAFEQYQTRNQTDLINLPEHVATLHAMPMHKDGKIIGKNSTNFRYRLNSNFDIWAKQNIATHFIDASASCTEPGLEFSGPHIDGGRNYSLMYLLKSGGDAITKWYKVKHSITPSMKYTHFFNYDDLECIDEIQIPLRTWTLLNVKKIHGCHGIMEGRYSLMISLRENIFS